MADESFHSCYETSAANCRTPTRSSSTDDEAFITASNSPEGDDTLGEAVGNQSLTDCLSDHFLFGTMPISSSGQFRPLASSSGASLRGLQDVMDDLRHLAADSCCAKFRITPEQSRCQDPVYHDNELTPHRPPARRTCSYPRSRQPRLRVSNKSPSQFSKRVRFADALGFDLETVLLISDRGRASQSPQEWTPQFSVEEADCLARLAGQKVALETVRLDCPALEATVRVQNLAPTKRVSLRITFNNWNTFSDLHLRFIDSLPQLGLDRFHLRTYLPPEAASATRIEFALQYCVAGNQFWDNNEGQNYAFQRD